MAELFKEPVPSESSVSIVRVPVVPILINLALTVIKNFSYSGGYLAYVVVTNDRVFSICLLIM